jgi:hypothetical protein
MATCLALATLSALTSASEDGSHITLGGGFGLAAVDPRAPALATLTLRGPDGQLEPQSLLSDFVRHGDWTRGGYTYVMTADGVRHESRFRAPDKVETERQGDRVTAIRLLGVKLAASAAADPVAVEDWTLTTAGDALVWKIVRRWQRELTYGLSGTPGLFSTFHSRSQKNATTSTIWYDPLYLDGRMDSAYRQGTIPAFQTSTNPVVDITAPDTWAVYRLWTNWNARSDLRLEVKGGSLFRRGSYALVSEAGAVTAPGATSTRTKGQEETITLWISPVDKTTTGYQLEVSIPDKPTEATLRGLYTSLLNGGTVNDQRHYNFGNESDGWYVGFNSLFQAAAIGDGVPAKGQISEHPFGIPSAFRDHLRDIFDSVDEQGLDHFGYNEAGFCVDENLEIIIAFWGYVLHTGDQDFLRKQLPVVERMLGYFINRRNVDGLFDLKRVAAPHWYYDTIAVSGVTTYHNALFYKATCDLSQMEHAVGNEAKVSEYAMLAAQTKDAVNRVLWKEDAPGGPRYLDWIDAQGREVSYFCDMCQWPALAYGLASPEQARKVVATADARIKQLEKEEGYKGYASMSALWCVPDFVNPESLRAMQVFPIAMNGGSYLAMTYWEIVGRAKAGDREGAWKRMKLFAQRAARDGWAGWNCFGPDGELEERARAESDGEPYLADMVAVPAALVNGILGIEPTWDKLKVQPLLPEDWKEASAEILYRGQRTRVTIKDGESTITPVGSPQPMPQTWSVDGNFTAGQGWSASDTIELPQGRSVSLKQTCADGGLAGLWKLGESAGPVLDSGPYARHGAISAGAVQRGIPGREVGAKAAGFDGASAISVPDAGAFLFGPEQSFTLQAWFKTTALGNQVVIAKPSSYCVGVKDGKLSAWAWGAGDVVREAVGTTPVADDRWHHIAAVFDRQAQRLALYLDGKPDGIPADISPVGASTSPAPLSIGGLGNSFLFTGSLTEASLRRGALAPEKFSFPSAEVSPVGGYHYQTAATGAYTSRVWDWGSATKIEGVDVAAGLNGGQVTLTLETSGDGFAAVSQKETVTLRDGVQRYALPALDKPQRFVRATLTLKPGPQGITSPLVRGFRVNAKH